MKTWAVSLLVAFFAIIGVATLYGGDDITEHPGCKYCGMDRGKFAHTRMFVQYDDGKTEGFCSIHCAAVDLAVGIDRSPRVISVGDYKTKELIDAEKAFWVVGGEKPGVMSARGKWAFKNEADATAFIKESGGAMTTFDTAMKAAYEDMHEDTKAIRERRALKRKTMDNKAEMGHDHK